MRTLYIYIYIRHASWRHRLRRRPRRSPVRRNFYLIYPASVCGRYEIGSAYRTFLSPHQHQYSRYIILLLYTITAVTVIGSRCSGTTLKAIVMVKSVCALQTVLKFIYILIYIHLYYIQIYIERLESKNDVSRACEGERARIGYGARE